MLTELQDQTKLDLIRTLRIIHNKYFHLNINAGGCGYFARLIARALISKGYDAKIVLTYSEREMRGAEISNRAVKENELMRMMRTPWRHVIVKVGEHLIDSTGIHENHTSYCLRNPNMGKVITENFDLSVLDYMLSSERRHNWNKTFNTNYVPAIGKIISQNFVNLN